LAAPATSAPVERLFSHAGNVITENRARLKCDIAADLVLLHDSWGVCADILPGFAKATQARERQLEEEEDPGDNEEDEDLDEEEDGNQDEDEDGF
jgi:hypothetical protein